MNAATKRRPAPKPETSAKRAGFSQRREGESVVGSILRFAIEIVGAGIFACIIYLVLDSAANAFSGTMRWDPTLGAGILFLMIGGTCVALCMPLLHTDSDARTKAFAARSAALLVVVAVLCGLGILSVRAPLELLEHHVMAPLRHLLNL